VSVPVGYLASTAPDHSIIAGGASCRPFQAGCQPRVRIVCVGWSSHQRCRAGLGLSSDPAGHGSMRPTRIAYRVSSVRSRIPSFWRMFSPVPLDGIHADRERLRDLLRSLTLRDQLDHLVHLLEVGEHELIPGREVLAEGGLGDAGLGDDQIDADGLDPSGTEESEGGFEYAVVRGAGVKRLLD
jgi:hypothetical protein